MNSLLGSKNLPKWLISGNHPTLIPNHTFQSQSILLQKHLWVALYSPTFHPLPKHLIQNNVPTVLTKIGMMITLSTMDDVGEKCMKCLWHNNTYSTWCTRRMIWHLLRIKGNGLAVCNGSIPPEQRACYHKYHLNTTDKFQGRKKEGEQLMTTLTKQQADGTCRL